MLGRVFRESKKPKWMVSVVGGNFTDLVSGSQYRTGASG